MWNQKRQYICYARRWIMCGIKYCKSTQNGPHSSGMLRRVCQWFNDFSGHPIGPILEGQTILLGLFDPSRWDQQLSRIVSKQPATRYRLRNSPEQRGPHLHFGGSLKSRTVHRKPVPWRLSSYGGGRFLENVSIVYQSTQRHTLNNLIFKNPLQTLIQDVSRLEDITAGGDFLRLCDQKSSY